MANIRKQQIKVWNRFNTGEENVKDKHLIRDTGFVTAENVNIDDATIRPLRGYSVDAVYPDNVKHVIKENIKGEDKLLTFPVPVRYVNYNNAVYYVEEDGSPLMVATESDGTTVYRPVNTTLSNLTVQAIDAPVVDYNPFKKLVDTFPSSTLSLLREYKHVRKVQDLIDLYDAAVTGNDLTHTLAERLQAAQTLQTSMVQKATDVENIIPTVAVSDQFVADLATFPFSTNAGIYPMQLALQEDPLSDWKPAERMQYTMASIIKNVDAYVSVFKWYKDRSYTQFISYQNPIHPLYNTTLDTSTLDKWIESLEYLKSIVPTAHANKPEKELATADVLKYYTDHMINAHSEVSQAGCSWIGEYATTQILDAVFLLGNAKMAECWIRRAMDMPAAEDKARKHIGRCGKPVGTMHDLNQHVDLLRTQVHDLIAPLSALKLDEDLKSTMRYFGVLLWDNATGATSYIKHGVAVNAPSGTKVHFELDTSQGGKYRVMVLEREVGSPDWRRVFTKDNVRTTKHVTFDVTIEQGAYHKDTQVHTITPTDNQEHVNYNLIAEHRGTLFMGQVGKQEVRFTYPNQPNVTDDQHVFMMPQPVKAMQAAGAGVFIFTTNRTIYLLTGHELKDVKIKRIGEGVGVLSAGSVGSVDNLVIWMSQYGIHNTSGYGSALSTKQMWRPPADKGVPERTVILNGVVYFIYPKGFIISYEYSTHTILKYQLSKDIKSVSIVDGYIKALLSSGNFVKSFAGTKLFNYKVELKRFAGYSFDTRLRFNNLTVSHDDVPYRREGVPTKSKGATVTLYVDDREVAKQDIKGYGASRIHFPISNNVGESVSIAIEGDMRIRSARLRYTTHDYED